MNNVQTPFNQAGDYLQQTLVVIFSAQRTLQALASVQASVGQPDCVTHVQALEKEITHLVRSLKTIN